MVENYHLPEQDRITIAALIAQAKAKHVSLPVTKLVKLLYLLDLGRAEMGQESVTSINWIWHNYGPFDNAIYRTQTYMVEHEEISISLAQYPNGYTGRFIEEAIHTNALAVKASKSLVSEIDDLLAAHGHWNATEIKDYTYQTAPMIAAQNDGKRGVKLDLSLARTPHFPDFSALKQVLRENPIDDGPIGAHETDEILEIAEISSERIAHANRALLDA